jgi:hypothetical protein
MTMHVMLTRFPTIIEASYEWPVLPSTVGALGIEATSRDEFPLTVERLKARLQHAVHELGTLPIMNYGKKDEDADSGLVKVDRTQVFQEGELPQNGSPISHNEPHGRWEADDEIPLQRDYSTLHQFNLENVGSSLPR